MKSPVGTLRFILVVCLSVVSTTAGAQDNDDDDASSTVSAYTVSTSIPVSQWTPNTLHKVGTTMSSSSAALGDAPQCGDGSAFSFYATRPTQKNLNTKKLLIEFVGGGACWDTNTCGKQASYLTFPDRFDAFVGRSCTEIQYGSSGDNSDGSFPLNLLCAQQVGSTDFTTYNYIVIPYCTQDVHTGNNIMTYDDGTVVNHVGGQNMMAVLRWIFKNFPKPSHIALTGCSAGATALPVAYSLLQQHYNQFLVRNVQISTISDSPVYLTPSYFLENSFGNWNPWQIMYRTGFPYTTWQYDEEYPTRLWDYILRRGSNRDKWGFLSHTNDGTSETYYKWMSGNEEDDGRRQLENQNNDGNQEGSWWSELSQSLDWIQARHNNVETYFIEDNGHCSFGLYYGMQQDGFDEWAGSIFSEDQYGIVGNAASPGVGLFFLSAFLGVGLAAGALRSSYHKVHTPGGDGSDGLLSLDKSTSRGAMLKANARRVILSFLAFLSRFESYPITAGYLLTTTMYFWTMILSQGFVHPINNPSLGPGSISLSMFGINNPSLIVYNFQILRLLTSSFVFSGVLTYLLGIWSVIKNTIPLEKDLKDNSLVFLTVTAMIAAGCNLVYAMFGSGASCGTMSLILGWNSFGIAMNKKRGESTCRKVTSTLFLFLLVSLVFPFDSWIVLLSAILLGTIFAKFLLEEQSQQMNASTVSEEDEWRDHGDNMSSINYSIRRRPLYVFSGMYAILFLALVSRLRRPDRLYQNAFYTGCTLLHTNEVGTVMNLVDNNRRLRDLQDNDFDYDNMCAEFCVPNIAALGMVYGVDRVIGLQLQKGQCQDLGYEDHLVDKTFSFATYSLDVEIFTQSNNYDDDGEKM